MGWREFRAWLRELNRQRKAASEGGQTDPDSWANYARDPWWAEQKAKRNKIRGR